MIPRPSEVLFVSRVYVCLQWQTEKLISSTTWAVTDLFPLRMRMMTFSSTWRTLAAWTSKKAQTSNLISNRLPRAPERRTSFARNTCFSPSPISDTEHGFTFIDVVCRSQRYLYRLSLLIRFVSIQKSPVRNTRPVSCTSFRTPSEIGRSPSD